MGSEVSQFNRTQQKKQFRSFDHKVSPSQYQQNSQQQKQQQYSQSNTYQQQQQQVSFQAYIQPPTPTNIQSAQMPTQTIAQQQSQINIQYARPQNPSHPRSNLQKMTHISASNPQLNNKRSSRNTPPASATITPAQTPFSNKNVSVFNFPSMPFGFEDASSNNNNNEESPDLHKNLSRHASENNINQTQVCNLYPELIITKIFLFKSKPAVLENIVTNSMNNLSNTRQKLLVLRHGERVDSTFGPNWVENCFDNTGDDNLILF